MMPISPETVMDSLESSTPTPSLTADEENNPKSIHVTSETVPDSTQDDLTQSFVRSNVDCVPETDTPDHINFEDLIEIVEVNDKSDIRGDIDGMPADIEADGNITSGVPSKLLKLPVSRIKSIIKIVPSIQLVNSEAIALTAKATEMFLNELVAEAHQMTLESGKKTLSAVHIDGVIQTLPQFEFLDGMLL